MDDESSDNTRVEIVKRDKLSQSDWDTLNLSVNPILFKKFTGHPISFHFKIDDLVLKRKYENLIVRYGGRKVVDYIDMDNTTALMIEDKSKFHIYQRPSFKVSYITDSIKKNTLLDISEYLHNTYSFKQGNFMNIVFWETETFKNNVLEPCTDSSDSSIEEAKISKHTRDPYSRSEKEAILKFLLSRKNLEHIKGDSVWKKMEKLKVCPKRTYQSMKNHFVKTMLSELDKYEFLSELDKKRFKNG